jgi:hypothetical protein
LIFTIKKHTILRHPVYGYWYSGYCTK